MKRPKYRLDLHRRLRQLGPGLITGAADDHPSGIATYSQAGAQFGYSVLWTVVFTLPLMAAIQIVSARIGYLTRRGLTANIKAAYPRRVAFTVVGLLAGSADYAVAEMAGWSSGLSLVLRMDSDEGRGFYGVIAAATIGGVIPCFTPTDPMQELFWAAVLNGVIAVPITAVMMRLATNKRAMSGHVIGPRLWWLGWIATSAMAATVVALFATL